MPAEITGVELRKSVSQLKAVVTALERAGDLPSIIKPALEQGLYTLGASPAMITSRPSTPLGELEVDLLNQTVRLVHVLTDEVGLSEDAALEATQAWTRSAGQLVADKLSSLGTQELLGEMNKLVHEHDVLEQRVKLRDATRRASVAAEEAEQIRSDVAEAAGEVAEGQLATEFEQLARGDQRQAQIFRGLTVAVFVAVIGYAAAVAWTAESASVELAQRLAVAVPVLLLGAYFSKEAGNHRDAYRWASVLSTQLRTIKAYTATLEPTRAAELRAKLGERVMLTSPGKDSETRSDTGDPAAVITAATDMLRAGRGQ